MRITRKQLRNIINEELNLDLSHRTRRQHDRLGYTSGIYEDDKPHPAQYDAPQGSKRDKDLDRCKKLYK